MEQIASSVIAGVLDLINAFFSTLGKGLGMSVIVAVASWFGVERLTPANWDRRKNTIAALVFGMVLTLLVHVGISPYASAAAAAVYGLLGGLLTLPFHHIIAKRYLRPLLTPSSGVEK